MSNVGSLPRDGQSVFDFETQAGITHLLASVRASDLSGAEKNELRDLIFLYANGGRDARVRATLEQKIDTYKLQPAPRKSKQKEVTVAHERPVIGTFRSKPSFDVKVDSVVISPEPKADFTQDTTWKKVPMETVATEPSNVTQIVQEPQLEPLPVEAVQPTPAPAPVAPPPVAAQTATPPTPQPISAPIQQEDALNRIREIKAAVNQKVGNPVNLVDIDNEVGREYMSALLDAMKKINTGSSASSAMSRLETAYAAVEETIRTKGVAPQPAPKATEAPVVEQPKAEASVAESQPEVPLPPAEPATPEPQVEASAPRIPITPIPTEVPDEHEEPVTIKSSFKKELPVTSTNDEARWNQPSTGAAQQSPLGGNGIKPLASLADLSKPSSPQAEASAKPVNTSELHTPEIDRGLEQLLEEWPLFKKSGLFGTGPKGREHPLFLKIAPLQIPLLLAGRFEGATQEIKQSITDYMNGWRYEQGLIYEQGETFEHYLRRVIKHILDLQKTR